MVFYSTTLGGGVVEPWGGYNLKDKKMHFIHPFIHLQMFLGCVCYMYVIFSFIVKKKKKNQYTAALSLIFGTHFYSSVCHWEE